MDHEIMKFPHLRASGVGDAMLATEAVHQAAARVRKVLESGECRYGGGAGI